MKRIIEPNDIISTRKYANKYGEQSTMKRLIDPKDISTRKYANDSGKQSIITRLSLLDRLENEVTIPQ